MKKRPSIKTTANQVYDYWKMKCLEETETVLYVLFDDTRFENIIEGNKRTCFCCGKEGSVQIAHIIPHALGGTDLPDNLLLLCSACHAKSPDVTDKKYMFIWLNQQPYYTENMYLDLIRQLTYFDNSELLSRLVVLMISSGIDSELVMIDWGKEYRKNLEQANTHGFDFSESTKAVVINQTLLNLVHQYEEETCLFPTLLTDDEIIELNKELEKSFYKTLCYKHKGLEL